MNWLINLDRSFFLFLNGLHSPLLDPVMFYGTNPQNWLPLFLLLLWLVIRKYRWKTLWVILFAALMIIVSDQLSNLVKELTSRPRPTFERTITGIHTINGYLGGQYGFYSAHASNNMALAVFLILILQKPFRGFALIILAWAFFMAYTRIYMGLHYPGDIIAGWLAGGLIGFGFSKLTLWFLLTTSGKNDNQHLTAGKMTG